MKKSSAVKFAVITVLVFALAAIALTGFPVGIYNVNSFFSLLEYGLDMQGGVELIYENTALNETDDMYYAVSSTMQKQQSRLLAFGIRDAVLTQIDDTQVRIEIPQTENLDEIVGKLAQSGELRFQLASGDVVLTGANIQYAVAGYMPESNVPAVSLQFDEEGTEIFAQVTSEHKNETLSIWLDDTKIAAPTIGGVIDDGVVSISNLPSIEDAEQLAGMISEGELNTEVKLVSQEQIESQMTRQRVMFNIIVLLAVLVIVCAYLVWRYGMGGVMGAVTYIFHALIVLMLLLTVKGTIFTMSTFLALLACEGIALVQINAVLSALSARRVKPMALRNAYPEVKKQLAKPVYGFNAALIFFGLAMQMETVVAITTVGRMMIFCGVAGVLCQFIILGGFLRLGAGMCKGNVLCKEGGFDLAGKKLNVKFAWVLIAAAIAAGIVALFAWADTSRLQSTSAWLALAVFAIGVVLSAAAAFLAGGMGKMIRTAIAVAIDMVAACMICAALGTLSSSTFAVVFIVGAIALAAHLMEENCVAGMLGITALGGIAMIFCGAPAMRNLAACMVLGLVVVAINIYTEDLSKLVAKFARK